MFSRCSDYVADLIKKLELCLIVVSVLLKGHLLYKSILSHKTALDVQLMNFLFDEKMVFRSQDIEIFVFL